MVGVHRYAEDFMAFIDVVKKLGRTPAGPDIFVLIPPPLMHHSAYVLSYHAPWLVLLLDGLCV